MGKLILNGKEYISTLPSPFPPLIYSTDEREVGVWTDGKPLYEKTWKYTFTSAVSGSASGEYVDLISLPDVEVKNIRATNGSGSTLYPFTSYSGSRGVQLVNFRYLSGYIKLFDLGTPYSVGETIYITAQYTKNTDTPGSGHWGTNGAPAKHYSTTEQVVGTWIDGKPLYEKTFKFQNDVVWTNGKEFDTGLSNIDYCMIKKAMLRDYGQSRFEMLPFYQSIGSTLKDYMQLSFNFSTNKLILRTLNGTNWSANNNRYLYVILQYTKSTD